MPYKDPDRKRQWEREHRQQRNAQRRQRRLESESAPVMPKAVHDPVSVQHSGNGWKIFATVAIGVGFALFGALAGVNIPRAGRGQ
jgi:hypothetical protein